MKITVLLFVVFFSSFGYCNRDEDASKLVLECYRPNSDYLSGQLDRSTSKIIDGAMTFDGVVHFLEPQSNKQYSMQYKLYARIFKNKNQVKVVLYDNFKIPNKSDCSLNDWK